MSYKSLLDYLCIGHVCQDITPDGYVLGGAASYCSITAHLLGKKPGVITSFGDDFQFIDAFTGIQIKHKKAEKTTIFKNVYEGDIRTQYIYQRAATLFKNDLPSDWLNCPLVHFGLIADEVDFEALQSFSKNTIIAATPQGWMRTWDNKTLKVGTKNIDWSKLSNIDIIFISDEDILGYESTLPLIIDTIDLVVFTRGYQPAVVFYEGKSEEYPVFPTKVVDPTGAGDTFATGFLIKYLETKDVAKAMAFGHAVASFCIEAKGLDGLKNLDKVEERYLNYLEKF